MLGQASRILIALLVGYSYFEMKTNLPGTAADSSSAIAVRVLLGIQFLGSILFFAIPYFPPEMIHFGWRRLSDYTPKQLERIMPLVRDMAGLMGLLFGLFFTARIHLQLGQANSTQPREVAQQISGLMPWMTGGLIVGETLIVLYYVSRFDAEAKKSSEPYHIPDEPGF